MAPPVINSPFYDFYKSLLTSERSKGSREDLMTYLDSSSQPAVSEYEYGLDQMFIFTGEEEIWEAILLIPSGKAPGSDRFPLKCIKALA